MTDNEFMGMFISAVIVLTSLIAAILKFTKPINSLNLNIVKLTDTIHMLIDNDKRQDERIKKHGEEIDGLKMYRENHEQRIIALERK